MNQIIENLQKRYSRVHRMFVCFKHQNNKEEVGFENVLIRFQELLAKINNRLRVEYNKSYIRKSA